MGFRVNDRVVCIDATNTFDLGIEKGKEYDVTHSGTILGILCIKVDGNTNPLCPSRFRKVEPKKKTNKLSAKLLKEFQEQQIEIETDVKQPEPCIK